jgi:AraC-like DNA-binding protein
LAQSSAVLHGFTNGTGPDYRVSGFRTPLSLKALARGSALYRTPQGQYRVTEDCFLILNRGQEYSLEIDGRSHTETLCPFFQPGLVEHVAGCLATRPERQLDEIETRAPATEFYERLYPRTGNVDRLLRALHAGLRERRADRIWLEDHFYALAAALVALHSRVEQEVAGFPGLRGATRAELYRRLHRARDFLCSCYDRPLTVAQAARVANLSPYHFHRTFKLAFGQTPMQFLQGRRLEAACRLLSATELPVTAVCLEVGFESLGAFSWLFRRRLGVSPRDFRGQRNPQD